MWQYILGGSLFCAASALAYNRRQDILIEYFKRKTSLKTYIRLLYQKHFAKKDQPKTSKLLKIVLLNSNNDEISKCDTWNNNIWEEYPDAVMAEIHFKDIDDEIYMRMVPRGAVDVFPIYEEKYRRNAFVIDLEDINSSSKNFDEEQFLKHSGPLGTFYHDTPYKVKLGWIRGADGSAMFGPEDTLSIKTSVDETNIGVDDFL